MKRRLIHIISVLGLVLSFSSCVEEVLQSPENESTGSNRIIISMQGSRLGTRAESVPENGAGAGADASSPQTTTEELIEATENRIEHIDVLIFKATGNPDNDVLVHHERVVTPENKPTGSITLQKTRDEFEENQPYYIYLIANTTIAASEFEPDILVNRSKLFTMMQQDERIHATGIIPTSQVDAGLIPPKSFLMDGIAYEAASGILPDAGDATQIILHNDKHWEDLRLNVDLRRAAAKIRVTIREGDDVTFVYRHETAKYHVHQVPYSTYLVADATGKDTDGKIRVPLDALVRESQFVNGPYFQWGKQKDAQGAEMPDNKEIIITAYAYSSSWKDQANNRRTSIVVSLPMYKGTPLWQKDENGNDKLDENGKNIPQRDSDGNIIREVNRVYNVDDENKEYFNYYRIPLSKERLFRRNTCYSVAVTINELGSTAISQPAEVDKIEYETLPWEEVNLNVGDENDRPTYFHLNVDSFAMHNVSSDTKTLHFSSSSPIVEAKIVEAYFFDKEGVKRNLTDTYDDDNGETKQIDIEAFNKISATYDPKGYSGPIEIFSPLPKNNAIRTIVIKFTNADGLSQQVTVDQYPLEYITHERGWYSYRDDFYYGDDPTKVTTYEKVNGMVLTNGIYSMPWSRWGTEERINNKEIDGERLDGGYGRYTGADWNTTNSSWDYIVVWDANRFFRSKAAHWSDNTADLTCYYYSNLSGSGSTVDGGESREIGEGYVYGYHRYRARYNYERGEDYEYLRSMKNPRMYHVVITSTSDKYTVGRPELVDKDINGKTYKVTDPSVANSKLVSPSFMLASQLGAVASNRAYSLNQVASHCASYVEVATDGTVYDDWRLPTRAEVKVIYEFQYKNKGDRFAAMAEVLSGVYYWCADSVIEDGYEIDYSNSEDLKKFVENTEKKLELEKTNPEQLKKSKSAIRCIRDAY